MALGTANAQRRHRGVPRTIAGRSCATAVAIRTARSRSRRAGECAGTTNDRCEQQRVSVGLDFSIDVT